MISFFKKYKKKIIEFLITIITFGFVWYYKDFTTAIPALPAALIAILQSGNEKQEEFFTMQIEEKKKQEKIEKEDKKFRIIFSYLVKFFTLYNGFETNEVDANLDGINLKKIKFYDKNFICKNNKEEILYKIFHLKIYNKQLHTIFIISHTISGPIGYLSTIKNTDDIEPFYLEKIKQQLSKILTDDVFDFEKCCLKDNI